MEDLLLSVCIPSRNSTRENLAKLAGSLRAKDLEPHRWELILVDNNQPPRIEQEHGDLFAWHPRLRFVEEPMSGFPYTQRKCMQASRAPVSLLLGDDLILCRDYLRKGLTILQEQPDVAVPTGQIKFLGPSDLPEVSRKLFDLFAKGYTHQGFSGTFKTNSMMEHTPVLRGTVGMFVRKVVREKYSDVFPLYERLTEKLRHRKEWGVLRGTDLDIHLLAMKAGYYSMTTDAISFEHHMGREEVEVEALLAYLRNAHMALQLFRLRWGWPPYGDLSWRARTQVVKYLILSRVLPESKKAQALIRLQYFRSILAFRRFLKKNPGIAEEIRLL